MSMSNDTIPGHCFGRVVSICEKCQKISWEDLIHSFDGEYVVTACVHTYHPTKHSRQINWKEIENLEFIASIMET